MTTHPLLGTRLPIIQVHPWRRIRTVSWPGPYARPGGLGSISAAMLSPERSRGNRIMQ